MVSIKHEQSTNSSLSSSNTSSATASPCLSPNRTTNAVKPLSTGASLNFHNRVSKNPLGQRVCSVACTFPMIASYDGTRERVLDHCVNDFCSVKNVIDKDCKSCQFSKAFRAWDNCDSSAVNALMSKLPVECRDGDPVDLLSHTEKLFPGLWEDYNFSVLARTVCNMNENDLGVRQKRRESCVNNQCNRLQLVPAGPSPPGGSGWPVQVDVVEHVTIDREPRGLLSTILSVDPDTDVFDPVAALREQ